MRKILITGSNGNLGRAIFKSGIKMPYSCYLLSKHIISDDSCRPHTYIKADISKEEDIDPKLWGVDEVFHMAGSTHEKNPKKYYINNFEEFTINAGLIINNKPVAGLINAPAKKRMFYSFEKGNAFELSNRKKINLSDLPARKQKI